MHNEIARWRPIFISMVDTLTAAEAVDEIIERVRQLVVADAAASAPKPGRPANKAVATRTRGPKPATTSQILNTTGSSRTTPSAPPASAPAPAPAPQARTAPDPNRPMLDDQKYYTTDEACDYLSVAKSQFFNLTSQKPDRFPHQFAKPDGVGGRPRKLYLGRGLNKVRLERDDYAKKKQRGVQNAVDPDHTEGRDDPDNSGRESENNGGDDLTRLGGQFGGGDDEGSDARFGDN